ncbi:MAG: sigma 54-interacting transcriptional regulator [Holophagales bacterium]|nr:sigma 54-interacting transcriptional regulator [Holophagales bacterium]
MPGELLLSELFGIIVRGALHRGRAGPDRTLRHGEGGTIFLDEVGDMPLHLRVKLLRVLQERHGERVGESTPRPVHGRPRHRRHERRPRRCHSHCRFRDDLYYRLRVVPIHVPPLRDRVDDIPLIAQHLLAHIGGREGRALRLSRHPRRDDHCWPGNVCELGNPSGTPSRRARARRSGARSFHRGCARAPRRPGSKRAAARSSTRFSQLSPPRIRRNHLIVQILESVCWNCGRAAGKGSARAGVRSGGG